MTPFDQARTYDRAHSVVFLKTQERFGGLSNMAGGFPLVVNGMRILTSEALYQACRFPHRPEVQRLIIEQTSPMTAKIKSEPYRHDSRPDWDHVRVKIMRWCLRVKLAQNWRTFSALLLETGERPIVEESRRDDFWGASPTAEGTLVGMNVLGRLLMELREAVKTEDRDSLTQVQPPAIPDFLLGERPIGIVGTRDVEPKVAVTNRAARWAPVNTEGAVAAQPTLFDRLEIREPPPPPYLDVDAAAMHVADLKPYPEYKESGLPWAQTLPATWRTERAKWLFTKMARPVRAEDEVVTCFRDGTVTLRRNRRLRGFTEATAEFGYQGIRKGDLVIHGMDAFAGAIGVSDSDGKGTPVYNVCQPQPGIVAGYFGHAVRQMAKSQWILALAKGIRERSTDFRFEMFGNQKVPLPSPTEQAAIVRFLDWANGRLDRAIRAKRKVIALLNEQKQAIIHRAVTRGLDPDVKLKPSGIPWIGEVPAHWSLVPNRTFLRIRKVLVGFRHGEYQLLSLTKNGVVVRDVAAGGKFSNFWERSQEVRPGDLVFCLFDVEETPRTVGLSKDFGMISGDYTVMECIDAITAGFVECFYKAMDDRKLLSPLYSGLRKRIQKPEFLAVATPIPPLDEQVAIVRSIEASLTNIEQAAKRIQQEANLLVEYRTRLVADVVTGKLDVREVASRLPDESPPESIDDETDLTADSETDDSEADEEEAAA